MKKAIGGMIMVMSFVFLLSVIGGVQHDSIGLGKAFMSVFGSFTGLLFGFLVLCDGVI